MCAKSEPVYRAQKYQLQKVCFNFQIKTMALNKRFDLKQIDDKTKYTVFGYIRNIQQLLPSNSQFYIIPDLVIYKCIKFYCWITRSYRIQTIKNRIKIKKCKKYEYKRNNI